MDFNIFYFTIAVIVLFWLYRKLVGETQELAFLGIAHPKPWPIFGNVFSLITQRIGFADYVEEMYKEFSEKKIFGIYTLFGSYTLMLSDPLLVKQIMVKDFEHFVNRDPIDQNDTDRLLSKSVLMLRDQKWKEMRSTLSPVYTSAKLKLMFGLLLETISDFVSFYEQKALNGQGQVVIETHDVFARVTADGIATTTLGFKGDCVRNEKSKIYEIADAAEADFTNSTTLLLANTIPGLFKLFGKQIFRKSVHEFFETNVLGEIQRRRKHNIQRPDVIQLLIQAQDVKVEAADQVKDSYVQTKINKISKWTDEELVAQALILFLGGFETTAALLQACCWELVMNQDVQQTLIEEVDEMLESLDGKEISYDELNQMKYLEMVVNETLRKWPAFRVTPRYCEKDYVLKTEDGKSYKIKSGIDVTIPIGAIQRDPKYFKDPEKFDPLRFSDENKGNIQSGTFLPFGMGPRICVGSRFAMLEAKLLLFSIMAKFKLEKCEKTPDNLTFGKGSLGYKETIYVALTIRK